MEKQKRKEYRVKPTDLQVRATDILVEKGGKLGAAMIAAGFDKTTAKNPKKLTESKGFEVYCRQIGLTKENIANMLMDDLNAKPRKRVGELAIAAKATGLTKEVKGQSDGPNYNLVFVLNQAKNETS